MGQKSSEMHREWSQWGRHPFAFSNSRHTLLAVHFWGTRNSPMRALLDVALPKCKHALSALDRLAERVKAQLLTCPHCSPGAPHLGVQGRQGWAGLGAPGLEGIPLHWPQVKSSPFTGKLLKTAGTWQNVSATWCFWRCSWRKMKALGEFLINWDCHIRRAAEFSVTLPICWLIALIKILGRFL